MNSLRMTGPDGELRHGYFHAATLGAWSFVGGSSGGVFTAAVSDVDAFRVSQDPLRVVVPVGQSFYRWTVKSLQIEGAALTAELGEKE